MNSVLIRRIEKSSITRWTKAFEAAEEDRVLFSDLILDLIEENNELSFWRVEKPEEELLRFAIATSLLKASLKNYDLLKVEEKFVLEGGFQIVPEIAKTVDTLVNERHVNVKVASAEEATKLGTLILRKGTVDIITAQAIERAIIAQLALATLRATDLNFKVTEAALLRRFIDGSINELRKNL